MPSCSSVSCTQYGPDSSSLSWWWWSLTFLCLYTTWWWIYWLDVCNYVLWCKGYVKWTTLVSCHLDLSRTPNLTLSNVVPCVHVTLMVSLNMCVHNLVNMYCKFGLLPPYQFEIPREPAFYCSISFVSIVPVSSWSQQIFNSDSPQSFGGLGHLKNSCFQFTHL